MSFVKIARDEDKSKCFGWIRQKGFTPMGDLFFFIPNENPNENKNKEIRACASLVIAAGDKSLTGIIDIFISDAPVFSFRLYEACMLFFQSRGCEAVLFNTKNPELEKISGRLGFKPWSKEVNQYAMFMKGEI